MALVEAYRKDTGEKVRVPERWLGHPVLGKPFTATPPQAAKPSAPSAPAAGDKKE